MLITVYQTDTGHRAVSFDNESNAQNKFTFKYWRCRAFNVVHQLSSFCALCNLRRKLYFWYLSCKHFPEITHQYILFTPFFLHLKHFEASVLLCVVKGILLDIGLNLRYSLVLQISNFSYWLKIFLLHKTIFVEEFYPFTKRDDRKHIIFVFCYSFKVMLFSKNHIRLLCQTPKLFLL